MNMADTTMINVIYSVTALDRDDDERRLFIDSKCGKGTFCL